ncbi:MAG TPA: tripartite tricarboxylate transporter TctB family protein [Burkholderiaceae bacterium]|nr:tripartite tricarboxylate transporter TctB family protein [Burkholderiaceae bacterium]
MKLSDAVFGLLLLALGAAVIATVSSYPTIAAQRVGPALFPGLIALGLVLGGLILIVRGWRDRAAVPWVRFEP